MALQVSKWLKSVLILTLVFAFVLAGCGSSGSNKGNDDNGKTASATDGTSSGTDAKSTDNGGDASGKKVEFTFWTPFSGPDGPFMKKIVDAYNSSQNKYAIKFVIQPNGEYYKQVDIALSTNKNRPDLMIMHVDQIPTYQHKGALLALDDLAAKAGINKGDFVAAPVDYETIDGKWYGIPLDVHPLVMYYNKDLFAKAGIANPPTNREEFLADVKKLTDGKGTYGYVVPTLWPWQFIFPTFMWQNGGDWVDANGQIAYNSPESVEVLNFFKGLIYDQKVSPANVQQDGENTLFLQGKNAIQFNGPWMKDQFDKAKLNYGEVPVPQLFDKKMAVFGGSHNFVVPAQVTDPQILAGIGDFLKYVAGHSIDWAKSGQAVASNAVRDSDEFKALEQQSNVAKEFPYVQFPPKIVNWGSISDPVWNAINLTLLDKKDAKSALDEAAAKSKQVMAANK